MTALNLENLPDGMLTQIEQLAIKNNCSVTEQAISLLKQSLNQSQEKLKFLISPETDPTWEERRKAVPQLQAEIDRHHRVNPAYFGLPDSTELIREDRER
ncbi:hypothetical protein Xen7305DRAFT_00014200 [Xenococcus sp. PCC 7305]|uniref:hypothetical protein n=1 Tax=Xenococcus sp. PCC 7305 TaxID=102125 RepID=UPI0002AC4691|nr:hypothetical protein [Xenococcus sp. PCC 7305]ELS01715.1 hypothetical protein Xen7305DRAFT_00014200 [Xenococcus sp. PCC 7305]